MDVPIDISQVILETSRLILRPWRENDLEDLFAYASVPGVGEMAGWKHHQSMEETKKILDAFIQEKNVFALEEKKTNQVIGSLGLHFSLLNQEPEYQGLKLKEIGYVLSKEYWGLGLMPEAVASVISFCFHQQNLDAVTVSHYEHNLQSRRVIEKCGFSFVRQISHHSKQLDKTFESRIYLLLRSSFEGNSVLW